MAKLILQEITGPRLSLALAAEIGLKESIVLLQLAYWIEVKGQRKDDQLWTYQTLKSLKSQFKCMTVSTLNRVIHRLEMMELIHVATKYNDRTGDKKRWFALNAKGFEKLTSVRVLQVKKTLYQNEPTLCQNEPALTNDLTNNKYNQKTQAGRHVSHEKNEALQSDLDRFDDWVESGLELLDPQPYLLPGFAPKERLRVHSFDPIPKPTHSVMYRICYRAETEAEQLILSSIQRGKVASVLGQLRDAGADFNQLHKFEAWWLDNWRSRDKSTGQYQSPRPEQVLEHWNEAMKSDIKPKGQPKADLPKHDVSDLAEMMRKHRDK